MQRGRAAKLSLIQAVIMLAMASPAHAVIKGAKSSNDRYTVRLIGNGNCSGVVVGRRTVVTAAHCAEGMRVVANGSLYRVARISRSGVLDDGRSVHVDGDASVLELAALLPPSIDAAPVGEGAGDIFTISGYGTTDERFIGSFGTLHEAQVIAAGKGRLVDPNRTGSIGASACFGDSGGPVFRGGMLVGVITRAAYPSARIACGNLTHWAPISIGPAAKAVATAPVAARLAGEATSAKVRAYATAGEAARPLDLELELELEPAPQTSAPQMPRLDPQQLTAR
jgi:hypothetical protein